MFLQYLHDRKPTSIIDLNSLYKAFEPALYLRIHLHSYK